jgi:hypothetical protein
LRALVDSGGVSAERYDSFLRLLGEVGGEKE